MHSKRHGDPLAGADEHVVLAGRLDAAHAVGQVDQVVGGLAHGADHGHHIGALAAGPGDVVGHGTDPVGVADRRPSEFLDDQWHWHDDNGLPRCDTAGDTGVSRWLIEHPPRRPDRVCRPCPATSEPVNGRPEREPAGRRRPRPKKRRKQIRNGIDRRRHRGADHPDRVPHQLEQLQQQVDVDHDHDDDQGRRVHGDKKAQEAADKVAVAAGCPSSTSARVNTQKYSAAPPMTIDPSKTYTATVVTTAGTFTIALDPKTAPVTVNNFVFLADKGFYHCVIFHRVIPSFMDQTGDPTGTGTGWSRATPFPTSCRRRPPTRPPSTRWARSPWPTPASPTPGAASSSSWPGPRARAWPTATRSSAPSPRAWTWSNSINAEGSTAGVPPDVTQRIISVTIQAS